jgi:hypothetical protein
VGIVARRFEDVLETGGCCLLLAVGLGLSIGAQLFDKSNDWVWWWWLHVAAVVFALGLLVHAFDEDYEPAWTWGCHAVVLPGLPILALIAWHLLLA